MRSTKCENNTIEGKKYELISIIKEFRELISMYRFRFTKESTKLLRKALRLNEKIVNNEKEGDTEYLKDQLNSLNNFKNVYTKKISIMITKLSILALMKLLDICLKIMMIMMMVMKIAIFTGLINNISHFLARFYYHLMNI